MDKDHKSQMKPVYHPDAYDKYVCLKPSIIMIMVMLYGIRHVLMVFLSYFPAMGGNSDTNVIKAMLSAEMVIADLPALLILITWNFRQPKAGKVWRGIWRTGRLLLLVTLCAQFVLLIRTEWFGNLIEDPLSNESALLILYLLVHISVMTYVVIAERIKSVFLEFPQPGGSAKQQV